MKPTLRISDFNQPRRRSPSHSHLRSQSNSGRSSSHSTKTSLELGERFDLIVEWIVGGLLVFSPLAFGVTQAWSREVFVIGVGAAALTVATKHLVSALAPAADTRRKRHIWTWAYVPIVLFLALCAAQLVPLPGAILRVISPGTLHLKGYLWSDLPNAAELLRRTPLSFYPHATRGQWVLVAAVAALFVIVADVYRESRRIKRLLVVITAVGFAVAGLAAFQNITGATTVYGIVPAVHRDSGPFMNYSHFSQFMNMSIGAAFALLLMGLSELSDYYRTPSELWFGIRRFENRLLWMAAATCLLGPITIFLCRSRMGMISMLASAVVTGGLLLWRGRSSRSGRRGRIDAGGRASMLFIMFLLVFALLLYVGFDATYARLATVENFHVTGHIRVEMLRDMLPMFHQFPLLGMGLGTYQFVFPMFDTLNIPFIATHAENEYAQLLAETGIVGVLLMATFVAIVVGNYFRATKRPREPIAFAAFGLGFGLLAILIHSGSDFGQHDPANAELTATFCALLFTLARRSKRVAIVGRTNFAGHGDDHLKSEIRNPKSETNSKSEIQNSKPSPSAREPKLVFFAAIATAGVIAFSIIALWQTDPARRAQSYWDDAQSRADNLQQNLWQGSNDDYIALLSPAARAVALEPTDATYRYWTDVYRWHSLAHTIDPATGTLKIDDAAVPFAQMIVKDLNTVRELCPSYGPPLCVAGQINLTVLDHPAEASIEIRKAARLTPFDRTVTYVLGLLAFNNHDWAEAKSAFARYSLLGGSMQNYTDMLLHAGHPEIPYAIADHNRGDLEYLASRMPANDPLWAAWIERCKSDAIRLLETEAAAPDAPPSTLAQMAAVDQQQGDLPDAIALYRKALLTDYAQIGWRLQLARLYIDTKQPQYAAQQAKVVIHLRPESAEARKILASTTTILPAPKLGVINATQPSSRP